MDSLLARLATHGREGPQRIALVDGERALGYGPLWTRVCAFADALRATGLRPHDRVAIALRNGIDAVVACYGAWQAGAIAVPVNTQARARDLAVMLSHCEAGHVVHAADDADIKEALSTLNVVPRGWPVPGHDSLGAESVAGAAGGPPAPSSCPLDEAAAIIYTSGTTGAPKGVTLSHGNLAANAEAVASYLALSATDSVLAVLPFYYAYGASVLHTHLSRGARLVLARNLLFPHALMSTIDEERITGLSGVPSTYALLLERGAFAGRDLSSLRYITQAGGPMGPALTSRLRAALPGPRLYVMYGQTEATSRLTWLPPDRIDDKAGSVGIPIDGVAIRVCRDDGTLAPAREVGGIQARGPGIMQGYWRDPDATARVLRDGWLHTGDMGYLDDEGYLFLAGRRSDLIKTGDHRVHPGDIEDVIREVDGVLDAAVVGVDDPILGQAIKAFIVAPGFDTTNENEVKAHCRARLPPFKIPRSIEWVPDLPRTASGKVRRSTLATTGARSESA